MSVLVYYVDKVIVKYTSVVDVLNVLQFFHLLTFTQQCKLKITHRLVSLTLTRVRTQFNSAL